MQHKLTVLVDSHLSAAIVARIVDKLINIGLEDAAKTIEQTKGGVEEAEQAVSLNIHAPVIAELPTAVIEINGGAVYCHRSNEPMRVVILDEDIEGSDGEQVFEVNGRDYYVHDNILTKFGGEGMNGVDPNFVKQTIEQLDPAPEREPVGSNDEVAAGTEGVLVTLDGQEIIGTAELLTGTAGISGATRKQDGSLEITYDGQTDIDWDGQETEKIAGEKLYVTAAGAIVPESEVKVVADK